jgi:hypothetical protein
MIKQTKRNVHGGYQVTLEFPNGFALSIVEHNFSYGLEAGLMKDGVLVYDEDRFYDVVGHLDTPDLLELIAHVASLPADYKLRESA